MLAEGMLCALKTNVTLRVKKPLHTFLVDSAECLLDQLIVRS